MTQASDFCTMYIMFWALYVISIGLAITALAIKIYTGDIFAPTVLLILLLESIGCATIIFQNQYHRLNVYIKELKR